MSIVLDRLIKRYGRTVVVNQLSLEVADGEFFVLLGPSGSGKSTVLRIIAGLTECDGGHVRLHGRDVTGEPPQRRGVGFVFQHYALFRHMTLAQNVEFALSIRRVPPSERKRRCDELLELVGLAGLGARMPSQLSGGQQQRVALARALAHGPEVLLLDEPFGALDAKIRVELRRSIRRIQRKLGVTTIFVTHDQDEAFELADRIGIMNFGRLLEAGPPRELYLRPQTEFVATFLGTANLMVGEVTREGVRLGPVRVPLGTSAGEESTPRQVQVLFRPEDVAVKDTRQALAWPPLGRAVVDESQFSGSYERLRLRLPPLPGVRPISPPAPFGEDFILIEASRSQHQARRYPLRPGDEAWVGVRRVHALMQPGLSMMLMTDGTAEADPAVELGATIARLAHARLTVLAWGVGDGRGQAVVQSARDKIGSGLASLEARATPEQAPSALAEEAARQEYDLVVLPLRGSDRAEVVEELLNVADAPTLLLLVPPDASGARAPARVLICVAVGEPGKEDVQSAGRLVRHVGAEATILTVLDGGRGEAARHQADAFLAAGVRTLSLLGVRARPVVRSGPPLREIFAELNEGSHDLLVLGTPLGDRQGRVILEGLVGSVLERAGGLPVLIVRSHQGVGREGTS